MSTASPPTLNKRAADALVDEMIELYCDWRTECAHVHAAYERFCNAPRTDRALAFAAFEAALDREESACASYAAQISLIESRWSGPCAPARARPQYWP